MPDPGSAAARDLEGPGQARPFSTRTLAGLRVIVTRPAGRGRGLVELLAENGAAVAAVPAISFQDPPDTRALDTALRALDRFDWVAFTSATSIEFCLKRMGALGIAFESLRHPRIAAIGPATVEALERQGIPVEVLATVRTGQGLVESLANVAKGAQLLLPRADIADAGLLERFREAGILAHDVVAYKTIAPPDLPEEAAAALGEGTDLVCFSSPSGVRNFLSCVSGTNDHGWNKLAAAIGPSTARAARESGLDVVVETAESSESGLVNGIIDWWSRRRSTHLNQARHARPVSDHRSFPRPG